MELDERDLFQSGAVVIFPNLVTSCQSLGYSLHNSELLLKQLQIGIDLSEWRAGPDFAGIKMIPAGFHIVHVGLDSQSEINLGRKSLVCWLEQRQVVPIFYSEQSEEFSLTGNNANKSEIDLLKHKTLLYLSALDKQLGPYPLKLTENGVPSPWPKLSSFITKELLSCCFPNFASCQSSWMLLSSSWSYLSDIDDSRIGKAASSEFFVNFTRLDLKRSFPANRPELITRYSLDKSYLLTSTLQKVFDGQYKLLFGEFQLCFLLFLTGYFYDAFEQWKRILCLICQSEEAFLESVSNESDGNLPMRLSVSFWTSFIDLFREQLEWIPQDFGLDELSSGNFVLEMASRFLDVLNSVQLSHQLLIAQKKFSKAVQEKFKVVKFNRESAIVESKDGNARFVDCDSEEQPTIVYI